MFNINTRSVTFNLIFLNVIFFAIMNFTGEKMVELFALFYPGSSLFKPWQIITHMFMHGGFAHILSNMFALFMFGAVLEKVWGPKRFLAFYLITGLGAAFLYTAVQAFIVYKFTHQIFPTYDIARQFTEVDMIYRDPTLGASGAVFGVLVAFGVLFPNTELMLLFPPIPIKAKYFVSGYVILEFYLGLKHDPSDNVAHFAHLGGALFGYMLVKYWNRKRDILY